VHYRTRYPSIRHDLIAGAAFISLLAPAGGSVLSRSEPYGAAGVEQIFMDPQSRAATEEQGFSFLFFSCYYNLYPIGGGTRRQGKRNGGVEPVCS
jgi:hypothetical protein